jgi:uncharacterized protein YdeI (YjbR/CyaY-like superfamily)
MMIMDVGDYFANGRKRCDRFDTADCSTRQWATSLATLRAICRDIGLSEPVKWGYPYYIHTERNIALLGAFPGGFRPDFMNPALLNDTEGVLEKQGPNSQAAGSLRFTDSADVVVREPIIRAYAGATNGACRGRHAAAQD